MLVIIFMAPDAGAWSDYAFIHFLFMAGIAIRFLVPAIQRILGLRVVIKTP